MANEKRFIDAKELKRAIWNVECDVYEFCEGCVTNMGISRLTLDDVIDEVSTVDAVEVVQCKDCEHYSEDGCFCWRWGGVRCPDHYCGDGERKNDELPM
jgi:hypothetical protein